MHPDTGDLPPAEDPLPLKKHRSEAKGPGPTLFFNRCNALWFGFFRHYLAIGINLDNFDT